MARALSLDPYKNYRFKVAFEGGAAIAGMTNVSALTRSTEVISFKPEGGADVPSSCPTPGLNRYEPITMSRGITKSMQFHEWAGRLNPSGYSNAEVRKDLRIELCDDAGVVKLTYHVYNCWVSQYNPLPDLDSIGNVIAVETITVQHEGWSRD